MRDPGRAAYSEPEIPTANQAEAFGVSTFPVMTDINRTRETAIDTHYSSSKLDADHVCAFFYILDPINSLK